MTSGHKARTTRPTPARRRGSAVRRFFDNRVREAAYSAFFTTVFLACSPAHSLAVDDIRVLSRLGQPLVAEILITPAAGETLSRGCFRTTGAAGDLPSTGRLRLALTRNMNAQVLRVTTAQPVREPMTEFVLQVKCPGVPTLVKTFLVMVDPPGAGEIATPSQAMPATLAPVSAGTSQMNRPAGPSGNRVPQRSRPRSGNIEPGSRYTVQPGDMLSTIADRVAGRPDWSVWPIAQKIFNSNPGAFLLGNPNVISQGSTIYIPQLSEIDMSAVSSQLRQSPASSASSRPAEAQRANTVKSAPATATEPEPIRRPEAATAEAPAQAPAQPAAPPVAERIARILDAPAEVAAPAVPLPTMQLTTSLLRESHVKMELRAQGMPVPPAVTQPQITQPQPEPEPGPQSQPDRPDSAANQTRAALQPGEASQPSSGINWLWVIVGLLTGLLIGAVAGAGLLRRNLRREYDHDVREGVQRHVQVDRMRREREREHQSGTDSGGGDIGIAAVAPAAAAAAEAAPTMELPQTTAAPEADYTVEMGSMPDLDFEVSEPEEPTSNTVEVMAVSDGLDLELPNTGQTGQHEVDFELLERAYSEDVDFQDESADAEDAEAGVSSSGEGESFYHLENRDPADDTPLPIELGDDEMGDDDDDDEPKVVRFPR